MPSPSNNVTDDAPSGSRTSNTTTIIIIAVVTVLAILIITVILVICMVLAWRHYRTKKGNCKLE